MNQEQIRAFSNALQLSIDSTVKKIEVGGGEVNISFEKVEKKDQRLHLFERLVPGLWDRGKLIYIITAEDKADFELLTSFLLLSRLKSEYMNALFAMSDRFATYRYPLANERGQETSIASTEQLSQMIFKTVAEKNMTLRELSKKPG